MVDYICKCCSTIFFNIEEITNHFKTNPICYSTIYIKSTTDFFKYKENTESLYKACFV